MTAECEQQDQVTLAEWAERVGRSEASIRNHWRQREGFPPPRGRRPSPGPGPGVEVYALAELEAWRAAWEANRARPAPAPYPVPGDPDAYRTLGAIARALGLTGKTLTQYRPLLAERAATRVQGARTLYRVGDVITTLNARRGPGVALAPDRDRRRR